MQKGFRPADLEAGLDDAERRKSWKAGVYDASWPVYDNYVVEEMPVSRPEAVKHAISHYVIGSLAPRAVTQHVIKSVGDSHRLYFPVNYRQLPFELAKVKENNLDDALEFVRAWGLLTARRASQADMTFAYGTPPWYVWGHARNIRIVLSLYESLSQSDPRALIQTVSDVTNVEEEESVFLKTQTSFGRSAGDRGLFTVTWKKMSGSEDLKSGLTPSTDFFPLTSESSASLATRIIDDLVNENLKELRHYLACPPGDASPPPWELTLSWGQLTDIVYWHLANVLAARNPFLRCLYCKNLFEQTHGRQQFCPPPQTSRGLVKGGHLKRAQSLCALRYRYNKYRTKHAKEA